jgi:prepilin-type N-terminal cleavage/methylation domain-containing protein
LIELLVVIAIIGLLMTAAAPALNGVLENGRLQKVAINPDGSTYAYRIIDPRQFILSTSFDL